MGRKSKEQLAKEERVRDLEEKKEIFLAEAEARGVADNVIFITTFNRYAMQVSILAELEDRINELNTLVEKEYVKGRKNVYINPAITEYNRTSTAANQTALTIVKLLDQLSTKSGSEEEDGFLEFVASKGE